MGLHAREYRDSTAAAVDMPFAKGLGETDRLKGIGGSDIAPIVGQIPPFHKRDGTTVYLEKVGEKPQFQGNKATKWGTLIEELLRRVYLDEREDLLMFTLKPGTTIFHPVHPIIYATPDGICVDKDGVCHIWEAKTVRYPSNKEGARWGDEDVIGEPVIPDNVRCQIAYYNMVLEALGCTMADYSRVSVLIGGHDDRHYTVARDRELEQTLLDAAISFWEQHVLAGIPPDPSHAEASALFVKAKYPKPTNDEFTPASSEVSELARRWHDANREINALKDKLKLYDTKLRDHIGESLGVVGDEAANGKPLFKLTWKVEKRSSTNRGNILKELGVTPESEVFKKHTKTTHSRVLRKVWNYEEE